MFVPVEMSDHTSFINLEKCTEIRVDKDVKNLKLFFPDVDGVFEFVHSEISFEEKPEVFKAVLLYLQKNEVSNLLEKNIDFLALKGEQESIYFDLRAYEFVITSECVELHYINELIYTLRKDERPNVYEQVVEWVVNRPHLG